MPLSDLGPRVASTPPLSRHRRAHDLRRHRIPFGRMGPLRRAARQEGGGDRHRGQRNPICAPHRTGCRASHRLSAQPGLGCAESRSKVLASSTAVAQIRPYRWYTRTRLFWIHEQRVKGFIDTSAGMADAERLARTLLQRKVADPRLRAALTPDYAIGCKRLLISNDYFPALSRDNVSLVTLPIAEMTAGQVITADGRPHPADVVIYASGFDTQSALSDVEIVGHDAERLSDRWQQGASAYLGTTVSGFPNYFVMLGPNSVLGHNSQIFMIEAQTRYILSCLKTARRRNLGALVVRPSVERTFNDWLQGRLVHSVWQAGGCRSWYQHPSPARTPRSGLPRQLSSGTGHIACGYRTITRGAESIAGGPCRHR